MPWGYCTSICSYSFNLFFRSSSICCIRYFFALRLKLITSGLVYLFVYFYLSVEMGGKYLSRSFRFDFCDFLKIWRSTRFRPLIHSRLPDSHWRPNTHQSLIAISAKQKSAITSRITDFIFRNRARAGLGFEPENFIFPGHRQVNSLPHKSSILRGLQTMNVCIKWI
jgi:hypothetical protein